MEIKQHMAYLTDRGGTYICIGYTDGQDHAILAPFWSDDEDMQPNIQNDSYMVVENPFRGLYLSEVQDFNGKGNVVFE